MSYVRLSPSGLRHITVCGVQIYSSKRLWWVDLVQAFTIISLFRLHRDSSFLTMIVWIDISIWDVMKLHMGVSYIILVCIWKIVYQLTEWSYKVVSICFTKSQLLIKPAATVGPRLALFSGLYKLNLVSRGIKHNICSVPQWCLNHSSHEGLRMWSWFSTCSAPVPTWNL